MARLSIGGNRVVLNAFRDPELIEYFPNADEIAQLLKFHFKTPSLGNKRNPFNELLFIILSSKTPPERYKQAHSSLRSAYPRCEALADASYLEVTAAIQHTGLQNRKARAIVNIAKCLRDRFGRVTLAPLKSMSTEEAEAFLVSLPEVRLKTARCVLMYALDRPVFPVDSHCLRICTRLGWIPDWISLTDNRASQIQRKIPALLRKDLHIGMVMLGRTHCVRGNPICSRCPIRTYCAKGQQAAGVVANQSNGRRFIFQ